MSLAPQADSAIVLSTEMACLRKSSFWLLVLGALLIAVGLVAISSSFIATLGILLMIGGAVEIVDAFLVHGWRGFWMHLLSGILYLALGFLLVQRPLAAAAIFTLMLATAFFVGGLFRCIVALIHEPTEIVRWEVVGWVESSRPTRRLHRRTSRIRFA